MAGGENTGNDVVAQLSNNAAGTQQDAYTHHPVRQVAVAVAAGCYPSHEHMHSQQAVVCVDTRSRVHTGFADRVVVRNALCARGLAGCISRSDGYATGDDGLSRHSTREHDDDAVGNAQHWLGSVGDAK